MNQKNKKIIFSGVQPSGNLHIGNYFGAIEQWVQLQENFFCISCVVDYHAITVKQYPKTLKRKILETAKIYLAAGIDPKKSIIFQQSRVSAHTELAWILNGVSARVNDLNKMTQFKDKSKNQESVSVGLFDYPVLMAADILLYNTDIVPVGEDQSQHVELTRVLARRFNSQYGETFKIPELKIKKQSSRIMALDDPNKKMSKSDSNLNGSVSLLDDPKQAAKKIMKAVTDSGSEIKFNPKEKPAISNLLNIFSLVAGKNIELIEKENKGKGYGEFKKNLAEEVKIFLTNLQKKYNNIPDEQVKKILQDGADYANTEAEKTLDKVRNKIGVNV